MFKRNEIAAISLSATALVAIALHEGYKDMAYIPTPGDIPTIGFGTTNGVKLGDKTTPTQALSRAMVDIQKFEGAVKSCVQVPLTQGEYDAYISLSYNIGSSAFCNSTLVKRLNQSEYTLACQEILKWNRFQGKELAGLTKRRQEEYLKCSTS
ncbi:MAG: lysozyme [Planctomycetia bacterium]|nr:lysozyme [Planctomycetia bacterium]